MRKIKFFLFVVLAIVIGLPIYLASTKKPVKKVEKLDLKKITLVTEVDTPGFFEHNNIWYGYMINVVRDYARYKNVELELELVSSCSDLVEGLKNGNANIGLSIILPHQEALKRAPFFYFDNYVVLSKRHKAPMNLKKLIEVMKGKVVTVTNAVGDTDFYKKYSQPSYGIEFRRDSTMLCRAAGRELAFGKVEYLICTKTSSKLLKYIFKGFNTVYEIDGENLSSFYFHDSQKALYSDFMNWYDNFYSGSAANKYNIDLYSTDKYIKDFINNGYVVGYKSASPFDYLFKKVGKETNVDWLLLCAIAHYESRFNRFIISKAGAKGLMQVMPKVAKDLGFRVDSLQDIKYNLTVGGYILNDIRKMLSYDNKKLTSNEMAIMLACYNGGYGHISDARRLAVSEGKNQNSWKDVEHSLRQLKRDSILKMDIVKYGKFNAGQTISYVNAVMEKYKILKIRLKSDG